MLRKKLLVLGMGGVLAAGLFGATALSFAQPAAAAPSASVTSSLVPVHLGGGSRLSGSDEALAEALGIELADLEAAEEEARIAMIDQAVADGLLTEAQAEQLKASSIGFGRGFSGYDKDEYLAAALGITVEELEAAELTALQTEVAAAVAAGTITQEQADLLLAQKAARNYLDTDGLNAAVLAAYEDALAAAVADGAITQAQADALLAQLATQSFNFGFGGRGGHGGRGGQGGPGGFGWLSPDTTPDNTPESAPDTTAPDTTTDTSFDA